MVQRMWMIRLLSSTILNELILPPFRKESAPFNMATDLWLFSRAAVWGGTIFRRYGWDTLRLPLDTDRKQT